MNRRVDHVATEPPGPAAFFSLGPGDETRRRLEQWFETFGDLTRVPAGADGCESWIVHDPADIRQVLFANARNYTKGIGLERVGILLGKGLMVSEGDFWHRQRRMIQPGFHRRMLAGLVDVIMAENRALASRWEACARAGETVEVTAAASELSLRIILRAIFGADFEGLEAGGANPFSLLTEETARDLRFAARFRALAGRVRAIIEARRARGIDADPKDFLGLLLAARDRRSGEGMGEKALIDETMTLVVAGHETTASVLGWMWYLLAICPEWADEVAEYLSGVPETRFVEAAAPEKSEEGFGSRQCLAGQVVREAMRLYPSGWLLSRRAIGPDRLGGFEVPAGSHVLVCPWIVQRHPGHWAEPERFHPRRFGQGRIPRFAYIPFGAGPRRCIGEPLAMLEMSVHLAILAPRFRLDYAGQAEPAIESAVNLRAAKGIPVRLRLR